MISRFFGSLQKRGRYGILFGGGFGGFLPIISYLNCRSAGLLGRFPVGLLLIAV